MKKRLKSVVLAIFLCLSLLPTAALAETDTITPIEPEKDENGVYLISNANELYGFAEIVNNRDKTDKWKPDANAVLTADITVNEDVLKPDGTLNTEKKDTFKQWTPIGYYSYIANSDRSVIYTGVFDGQNHTISGLYYDTDQRCAGLFGYLNNTIKNVTVADSYFSASSYVGGVCGWSYGGTISGCTNEGTVTVTNAYGIVGGVCGYNDDGIIKKCSNSGKVIEGTGATKQEIGGVCGRSRTGGYIAGCYNTGTVAGTDSDVGGVCGYPFQSYIVGCYNIGTVTGTGKHVGGVYGNNDRGHIIGCYYLDNDAVEDNEQARTADDFKNGTVCDLLNEALKNENQEITFYQGKDYPVLTPRIAFIGIEDGKTYCGEVNFTVRCAESVTENGVKLELDNNDQYILLPGEHTITATDADGKSEIIKVTVNAAHTPADAVRENEVAATCDVAGSYDEVVYCSVCNAEMSRTKKTIEKSAHTPADAIRENEVAATCDVAGSYDEVVYCSVCNAEMSRTKKTIEKSAHTPADAIRENEVAATCDVAGSYDEVVYCSVCNAEMSRTKKTIEKSAHTPADAIRENEVTATCDVAGSYDEVVYCSVCNAEMSRTKKTIEKSAHTPSAAVEENRVEATCTADGSYEEVIYCSVCNAEMSRTKKTIEKSAHTPAAAVEENRVAATCTADGSYEEVIYCSVCNAEMSRTKKTIEKSAHTPSAAVEENRVAATCTADGSYEEVIYCSVCNAEMSRTQKTIEKSAHTPSAAVEENRVAATCTADGSYEEVIYCSVCKTEMSRTQKTIEKSAHTPSAAVEENRVEATCTADGSYEEVIYCSVCKTEMSRTQKTIDKLPHDFGNNLEYCANGCGTKNPNYVPPYNPPHKPSVKPNPTPSKPETPENPFVDVKEDDYYYDAVIWAVGKGIAKGVTDTTFQPNASCTRAEMVTFLYRAAGSPEPTNKVNPFTDVAEDSYYYKAVLWAVEKGIAKGTSETTFSPNDTCTRGQTVAFLYRYANSPAVSGSNSFADVSETAYYYDATLWAVSEKVTEGTSATTFSPNDLCTRGQIVTFLYRYMGK